MGRYLLLASFLKTEMMDWGSLMVVSAYSRCSFTASCSASWVDTYLRLLSILWPIRPICIPTPPFSLRFYNQYLTC